MTMRISKYPPMFGIGADSHLAIPPSMPPPPPAPPNPAPIPSNRYLVMINNGAAAAIFGKWTLASVATEGMGDVLWQYDWGPGQFHQAIGPALVTPSMLLLLATSSIKYWVPSFAVQEACDGGALAAGSSAPVAVSYPAFLIPTQDCQDINGLAFVAPTSVCFQQVSTRWVGFSWGDLAAGLIGMAGDAAMAAMVSHFGGKLFPSTRFDDQLFGALIGHVAGYMNSQMDNATWGETAAFIAIAFKANPAVGALLLAPVVGWGVGKLAGAVGGEPRPNDWGYTDSGTGAGSAGGGTDGAGGMPDGGTGGPDGGTGGPDGGTGRADDGTGGPDGGTGSTDGGTGAPAGGGDAGTTPPDASSPPPSSDSDANMSGGGPLSSSPDDDVGICLPDDQGG
jgi:hypothetical protein